MRTTRVLKGSIRSRRHHGKVMVRLLALLIAVLLTGYVVHASPLATEYRLTFRNRGGAHWLAYLDTDGNAHTGYPIQSTGADYLLLDDALFKYSGDGSTWEWSPTACIVSFQSGRVASWQFAVSCTGASTDHPVVFQSQNASWAIVFTSPPLMTRNFALDYQEPPLYSIAFTSHEFFTSTIDPFRDRLEVFIDTDQDPSTGCDTGKIGAEVLLSFYVDADGQGHQEIYRYAADDRSCSATGEWLRVYSPKDDTVVWEISSAILGDPPNTYHFQRLDDWTVVYESEAFADPDHTVAHAEPPVYHISLTSYPYFTLFPVDAFKDRLDVYIDADLDPSTGCEVGTLGAEFRLSYYEDPDGRGQQEMYVYPSDDRTCTASGQWLGEYTPQNNTVTWRVSSTLIGDPPKWFVFERVNDWNVVYSSPEVQTNGYTVHFFEPTAPYFTHHAYVPVVRTR